jgi:DNA-directed RNA polymerase subunit omega
MINPSLDGLLKHADSRYTLATVAAKRARQIIAKGQASDEPSLKAVTVALEEIIAGKTKYVKTKSSIK